MNKFIKIICLSMLATTAAHAMQDDAELGKELIEAAANGTLERLNLLIQQGAPVDQADNHGRTALIHAAIRGHLQCVQALIPRGAKVDQADKSGLTALMGAAEKGYLPCVQALIGAGAKVDHVDNYGWTALMFAVKSHNHDVLQALIASGARANLANKCGTTALKYAVLSNDFLPIPKDLLLSTCELLVEAMLRIPNQKQKTQMVKFLSCLKHRRQGLREIDRNRKEFFETAFTQEVYFQNRDNFAKSVAYQEIAKLPEGPIKKALLEKYNRNPNTNSANESGKK